MEKFELGFKKVWLLVTGLLVAGGAFVLAAKDLSVEDEEVSGTIAAADRYRADQISASEDLVGPKADERDD